MVVLDLIIIGGVVLMIVAGRRFGMFEKGRHPRSGRLLTIAGAVLTALFYAVDLFVMTVLPLLVSMSEAMAIMHALHLEIRWPVSILSLFLICSGVVLSAYHRRRAERLFSYAGGATRILFESVVSSFIQFNQAIAFVVGRHAGKADFKK